MSEKLQLRKVKNKKPYPLGAHVEGEAVRFAYASTSDNCGVLLFDKKGKQTDKLAFVKEEKVGNVYCKYVEERKIDEISYLFYEDDKIIPDERARVFKRDASYGKECSDTDYKAGFVTEEFDWGEDENPKVPYKEALVYCLHVRGFTRHASSGVKHKGTFAGIAEKIPYLKEIGVTTVELQPAYEYTEMATVEERKALLPRGGQLSEAEIVGLIGENKLNYWGYKKGCYYAPKQAFAASKSPVREFKEMVKAFHAAGLEVVMQFYFSGEMSTMEIADILRFWVLEYHVDGFHLMGEGFSAEMLAADPMLSDTKLWYYRFDTESLYAKDEKPAFVNLAEYNDGWYYDMRKFLKGDENMLSAVLYQMRHIPEKMGSIHYLSNYYGFTLADFVSYDYKHNEANGEENRDGTDCNCSWNCGEEGPSRKARIKQLRLKQMKNAVMLLLLCQSTPLIFMGDEFGNSQSGNNNPYCQDNAVAWVDWNQKKKNAALFEFWKMMVGFRRSHPVLTPEEELRLMDYIACGYPDLSYHGENAWKAQMESHYRHAGIMLCGKYAKVDRRTEDNSLYIAMNMHWEPHTLALPKPPKGYRWRQAIITEECSERQAENEEKLQEEATGSGVVMNSHEKGMRGLRAEIPARCIAVYLTEKSEK